MARHLRHAHRQAVAALGFDIHRELRDRFEESSMRRAVLIDGELAALGGIVGPLASAEGYVWLALTEAATRHPVALAREAQRQLAEALATRRRLAVRIVAGDDAAERFARFLGFVVSRETGIAIRLADRKAA